MNITLRVRSTKGVQRVQVDSTDTLSAVYDKIAPDDGYYLSKDPGGRQSLSPSTPVSLFAHGDFVFLHSVHEQQESTKSSDQSMVSQSVDDLLSKRTGKLKRRIDTAACRHGQGGMCEHCQPLEPWQIPQTSAAKHLPLHVYLRKIEKSFTEFNYGQADPDIIKIQHATCKGHENVKEMCSKCLPSSIPLKRQLYRLVDHVEFSSSQGVEDVVGEWRRSGMQRFAWLFGSVQPRSMEDWDLGVKVVVQFVYQPPQNSGLDGVQLHEDDAYFEAASTAAKLFNAELIGCIYTDLHDNGSGTGQVKRRDYFVSSPELTFMASQQATNSRFITCILSGSKDNSIEIEAYMASQSAVYYIQSGLLAPTTDPNVLMVKKGEFIFTEKNEYGYEVPVRGNQVVPVDYFVVSLTNGFQDTINASVVDPFPPMHMHPTVEQAVEAFGANSISFNFLVFLCFKYRLRTEHFPPGWSEQALTDALPKVYKQLLSDYSEANVGWTCSHCTFINDTTTSSDCAMCGLPKV